MNFVYLFICSGIKILFPNHEYVEMHFIDGFSYGKCNSNGVSFDTQRAVMDVYTEVGILKNLEETRKLVAGNLKVKLAWVKLQV